MASASGNFQALATVIKASMVANASLINVYDYDPFTTDWATFHAHFGGSTTVPPQGWGITREACNTRWIDTGNSLWAHRVVIRGWLAVNVSLGTAKTIQNLADIIMNIFTEDADLGGAIEMHQQASLRTIQPRIYGGVLMHYAEIVMECDELVIRN